MKDRLGVELEEGDVIFHCEGGCLYAGIVILSKPSYIKYILIGGSMSTTCSYFVKRPKNVLKSYIDESTLFITPSGYQSHNVTFGEVIQEALYKYGQSGQQIPSLRNSF